VLSFVGPVRIGWRIEDLIVIRERIRERRWKREKTELIYISKNYYMRPERRVHQRLRALRRFTVTLDATSARCHVRTLFPIYPWVLDVPHQAHACRSPQTLCSHTSRQPPSCASLIIEESNSTLVSGRLSGCLFLRMLHSYI